MSIWTKWQRVFTRIEGLENRLHKLEQLTWCHIYPLPLSNAKTAKEFSGYMTETPKAEPLACNGLKNCCREAIEEYKTIFFCDCDNDKPSEKKECNHNWLPPVKSGTPYVCEICGEEKKEFEVSEPDVKTLKVLWAAINVCRAYLPEEHKINQMLIDPLNEIQREWEVKKEGKDG